MILKVCVSLVCAILWRMSGSDKFDGHWHRNFAIPLILSWYLLLWHNIWMFIVLMGTWQILRIGYGVPDEWGEKGSHLGRIFRTEPLTRAVAGVLYTLPVLFIISPDIWWKYAWVGFTIGFQGSLIKLLAHEYELMIGVGVSSIVWLI